MTQLNELTYDVLTSQFIDLNEEYRNALRNIPATQWGEDIVARKNLLNDYLKEFERRRDFNFQVRTSI